MALSKRLRFEILRRDNHACRYCGATAPDVKLTVDHVIPAALGGSDEASNLVTACAPCNSGKSSSSPDAHVVADVAQKALLWAEAMKIAAVERDCARDDRKAAHSDFLEIWNQWTYTTRAGEKKNVDLPPDWKTSVERFYAAGLDYDDFEELVEAAMTCKTATDTFRYFCGCCWTRVRQAQDRAAEIISGWENSNGS